MEKFYPWRIEKKRYEYNYFFLFIKRVGLNLWGTKYLTGAQKECAMGQATLVDTNAIRNVHQQIYYS